MKLLARANVAPSSSSVVVEHNAGLPNVLVRVLYGGVYRQDLLASVVPTEGNEQNSCTVNLTEEVEATVQVLEPSYADAAGLTVSQVVPIREAANFGSVVYRTESGTRLQGSSTEWTEALALSDAVDIALSAGTYSIGWSFSWQYSHAQKHLFSRILLKQDGEDDVVLASYSPKGCGGVCPTSGEAFRTLTAGSYNLVLEVKAEHHRDWYRLDERSLRIWRVR